MFHGMGADKRGWFQLLLKVHCSCSCGCQDEPCMSILSWETLVLCMIVGHIKSVKNLILLSFYYLIITPMVLADLESAKTTILLRTKRSRTRGLLCYTFKIYVFLVFFSHWLRHQCVHFILHIWKACLSIYSLMKPSTKLENIAYCFRMPTATFGKFNVHHRSDYKKENGWCLKFLRIYTSCLL